MKAKEGLITAEDLLEEVLEKLDKLEGHIKKFSNPSSGGIPQQKAADADFSFIDNHDLQESLHISDRTALKLRKKGLLKYYKVDGKIFYKKKEVEEMIEKGLMK